MINRSAEATAPVGPAQGTATISGPRLVSFTPVQGPPSTVVTITGTNLENVESVTFAGQPASFFQPLLQRDEIKAVVPAQAKTGRIAVKTKAGVAQSSIAFTISPLGIAIAKLIPNAGQPGDEVAIVGNGFEGIQSVTFAAANSTRINDPNFAETSSTRVDCLVPEFAQTGILIVATKTGMAGEVFTVGQRPQPEMGK